MFFIFLGTLGLAALVERARARAASIELEPKPHLTEYLGVRLPKGWELPIQESFELPLEVVSKEKAVGKQPGGRVIRVILTGKPPREPRDLLIKSLRTPGNLGEMDSFNILGEPGVIASFDTIDADSDEGLGPQQWLPGWFAAAVLPKKGPDGADLGVVIAVQGLATQGPAGEHLARQIADGLTIRSHPVASAPVQNDDKP
jgi:hypothetical protein